MLRCSWDQEVSRGATWWKEKTGQRKLLDCEADWHRLCWPKAERWRRESISRIPLWVEMLRPSCHHLAQSLAGATLRRAKSSIKNEQTEAVSLSPRSWARNPFLKEEKCSPSLSATSSYELCDLVVFITSVPQSFHLQNKYYNNNSNPTRLLGQVHELINEQCLEQGPVHSRCSLVVDYYQYFHTNIECTLWNKKEKWITKDML